jgi:phenylalanyl-tRNA synthetase beta chain
VEGPRDGAQVTVEALMNRPDLFSPEGVARALVPFMRLGPVATYSATPPTLELRTEAAVEAVRPVMVAAVVRGVELDDDGLAQLIDTQEKLDLTYGRRRTRASIGLHDASAVVGPITYTARDPDSFAFTPLGAEDLEGGARALTMRQVLDVHPKGKEYAHILAGADRYPLLIDAKGTVLSMPPIINGTATALRPGKRDVLLDVTGTAPGPVRAAARLLCMLLADRGGTIEGVKVVGAEGSTVVEPDLGWAERDLDLEFARRLAGARLQAGEAAGALERMGHRVLVEPGGARLRVASGPWRFDLLHAVDLVEDLAIGVGYGDMPATLPELPTVGRELPHASVVRRLRMALVGLGFLELATLGLRDAAEEQGQGGPRPAAVANPVTLEHSVLRTRLLPSLLGVLKANTRRDLPQAVFEVADVVVDGRNETRVAAAYLGTDASFSRLKGLGAAVLLAVGVEPAWSAADAPPFMAGRTAQVRGRGAALGLLGELSPTRVADLGLAHPVGAFEFSVPAIEGAAAPPG